jgi:hypothetical protein
MAMAFSTLHSISASPSLPAINSQPPAPRNFEGCGHGARTSADSTGGRTPAALKPAQLARSGQAIASVRIRPDFIFYFLHQLVKGVVNSEMDTHKQVMEIDHPKFKECG